MGILCVQVECADDGYIDISQTIVKVLLILFVATIITQLSFVVATIVEAKKGAAMILAVWATPVRTQNHRLFLYSGLAASY